MKTITLYRPDDPNEYFGSCSISHDDPIWATFDIDLVRCGTRFITWLKAHLNDIHWKCPRDSRNEYQWRNPVLLESVLTNNCIQVSAERWQRPLAQPVTRTITGPDGQTYTRTGPGNNDDVPWVQAQTECSSWYCTPTIKPVTDMVSFSIGTLELKVYDDA